MSNSAWKDPFSNAPAVGTPVWLKRILVNTHPFHATLTGLTGNAYTCGPNNWPILDCWLWSWKPLPQPDIAALYRPSPATATATCFTSRRRTPSFAGSDDSPTIAPPSPPPGTPTPSNLTSPASTSFCRGTLAPPGNPKPPPPPETNLSTVNSHNHQLN